MDFNGWQFIKPGGLSYEDADTKKPFVCFGSFQDYLGRNRGTGGIKTKNEWVHATHWDCVILDEYHYGAWRESAKELFEAEDRKELEFGEGEGSLSTSSGQFIADRSLRVLVPLSLQSGISGITRSSTPGERRPNASTSNTAPRTTAALTGACSLRVRSVIIPPC